MRQDRSAPRGATEANETGTEVLLEAYKMQKRRVEFTNRSLDNWTFKFIIRVLYECKAKNAISINTSGYYWVFKIDSVRLWVDVRYIDSYTPECGCDICGTYHRCSTRKESVILSTIEYIQKHLRCTK